MTDEIRLTGKLEVTEQDRAAPGITIGGDWWRN
jgi:hypothetical protein